MFHKTLQLWFQNVSTLKDQKFAWKKVEEKKIIPGWEKWSGKIKGRLFSILGWFIQSLAFALCGRNFAGSSTVPRPFPAYLSGENRDPDGYVVVCTWSRFVCARCREGWTTEVGALGCYPLAGQRCQHAHEEEYPRQREPERPLCLSASSGQGGSILATWCGSDATATTLTLFCVLKHIFKSVAEGSKRFATVVLFSHFFLYFFILTSSCAGFVFAGVPSCEKCLSFIFVGKWFWENLSMQKFRIGRKEKKCWEMKYFF